MSPVSSHKIFRINLILATMLTSCYPILIPPAYTQTAPVSTKQNTIVSPVTGPEVYIGLIYPPYPDSTSTGSGMVIFPSHLSNSWVVETVANDHQVMLWLSKVTSRDENGNPTFQVSDIAVLPPEEEDFRILVSQCLLSGSLEPEIVALVRIDEDTKISRYLFNQSIILTWIANRTNGKLEKIDTKNIECYAETVLGYP